MRWRCVVIVGWESCDSKREGLDSGGQFGRE